MYRLLFWILKQDNTISRLILLYRAAASVSIGVYACCVYIYVYLPVSSLASLTCCAFVFPIHGVCSGRLGKGWEMRLLFANDACLLCGRLSSFSTADASVILYYLHRLIFNRVVFFCLSLKEDSFFCNLLWLIFF